MALYKPAEKYLIATDVDGTILNKNGVFDLAAINYFLKLNQQFPNVVLCLVTGRNWNSVKPIYEQINLDSVVVCCNGAQIIKPLEKNFIPRYFTFNKKILKSILQIDLIFNKFNLIKITTSDEIHVIKTKKGFLNFLKLDQFNQVNNEIIYFRIKINFFENLNDILNKIKLIAPNLTIHMWENESRGYFYLELHVNYVNKGFSIDFLTNYYGISNSNVFVFGDNINDLKMLEKKCYHTFALKNASNIVKLSAQTITEKDNNNLGVIYELQKIFLVK